MHNYNESWRKHIDKHTIDLRNAKKPQPARNNNVIDVPSKQTEERVMRYLANMTPEEIDASKVEVTNQSDLQEYSEALHRSVYDHKQTASTSSDVRLAQAQPSVDIQASNAHAHIDRHSLLHELNAELANMEFSVSDIPQPTPLPKQNPATAKRPPVFNSDVLRQENYPAPTPVEVASQFRNRALLADIPSQNSKTLDTKLSSFAYKPSIDSGEMVKALATKTKKSFIKKIFIVLFIVIVAISLVGAGFIGGKLVNAQQYAKQYAREGYQYMESGKDALLVLDASTAHNNFQQAYQAFNNIENSFGFFSRNAIDLADLIPFQNNISSSAKLLESGKLYAQAGIQASLALSKGAEHSKPRSSA